MAFRSSICRSREELCMCTAVWYSINFVLGHIKKAYTHRVSEFHLLRPMGVSVPSLRRESADSDTIIK